MENSHSRIRNLRICSKGAKLLVYRFHGTVHLGLAGGATLGKIFPRPLNPSMPFILFDSLDIQREQRRYIGQLVTHQHYLVDQRLGLEQRSRS